MKRFRPPCTRFGPSVGAPPRGKACRFGLGMGFARMQDTYFLVPAALTPPGLAQLRLRFLPLRRAAFDPRPMHRLSWPSRPRSRGVLC